MQHTCITLAALSNQLLLVGVRAFTVLVLDDPPRLLKKHTRELDDTGKVAPRERIAPVGSLAGAAPEGFPVALRPLHACARQVAAHVHKGELAPRNRAILLLCLVCPASSTTTETGCAELWPHR